MDAQIMEIATMRSASASLVLLEMIVLHVFVPMIALNVEFASISNANATLDSRDLTVLSWSAPTNALALVFVPMELVSALRVTLVCHVKFLHAQATATTMDNAFKEFAIAILDLGVLIVRFVLAQKVVTTVVATMLVAIVILDGVVLIARYVYAHQTAVSMATATMERAIASQDSQGCSVLSLLVLLHAQEMDSVHLLITR
jgi:hypothetical protein